MADSYPVLNRFRAASTLLFLLVAGGLACAPAPAPERVPPAAARLVWWDYDDQRLVAARLDDDEAVPLALPVDTSGPDVPESDADRACQKCHALTAARIAFTTFGIDGPGGTAALDGGLLLSNALNQQWNFSALHRGGERLVTNSAVRLDVRDAATGAVLTEDAAGMPAAQPAFASAGDALVFVGDLRMAGAAASHEMEFDESTLYVARLAGDALVDVRRLAAGDGQALCYPAPSPDGRYVVYTRAPWSQSARGEELTPGRLELVDVESGEVRPLLAAAPGGHAFMPSLYEADDGLWLAFIDRDEGLPRVMVAPLDPARAGDPSGPATEVRAAAGRGGLFPRFVPPG